MWMLYKVIHWTCMTDRWELHILASFQDHSQILSRSYGEKSGFLKIKSGSGLGTRLRNYAENTTEYSMRTNLATSLLSCSCMTAAVLQYISPFTTTTWNSNVIPANSSLLTTPFHARLESGLGITGISPRGFHEVVPTFRNETLKLVMAPPPV